ncbi:MAG: hypothetical protein PHX38_07405 [Sulfuricella sp.]|nr:hypothetical protein [Sulfuricella sp.]
MANETQPRSQLARTAIMGAVTLALYIALFAFEEHVLKLTAQGKWSFVIPIAIAFAISYFHGAFTGGFWDALGVKAKK